jgi:YfiH family protein
LFGNELFRSGIKDVIVSMMVSAKNGVSFYRFLKLAEFSDIWHAIFSRHAGRSRGPFRSLNVSFGVGDDEARVLENRNIVAQCAGSKELVFVDQVHGHRVLAFAKDNSSKIPLAVATAPENMLGNRAEKSSGLLEPIDGRELVGDAVISNVRNKFLVIQVADCQSILMYDPISRSVANVHSGWRGSIQNIIGRTIRAMEDIFGCNGRNILAGIGPSLGPCCSEFVNYKTEIPAKFWKYKNQTDHFDFWSVSRDQLCQAGVLAENIEFSNVCTRCDTENFFSFRGEKTTGRFAAVIGLIG